MSGPNSVGRGGGRGGKYKQGNKQLIDSLREACPPHRLNDLEGLVRDLKGDEEKIRERISEWWEEPIRPTEGEWEDVNKRSSTGKKKDIRPQRGGRGDGRGRGRGGRGGREAKGRGRGPLEGAPRSNHDKKQDQKNKSDEYDSKIMGVPPVGSVRIPQGAWAKQNETSAIPQDYTAEAPLPSSLPTEINIAPAAPAPEPELAPVGPSPPPADPKPAKIPGPAGNVWATKGSAHLIRAEKPKPPAPVAPPISRNNAVSKAVAPIARSTPQDPSPVLAPIQRSTPQSPNSEQVSPQPVAPPVEVEQQQPSAVPSAPTSEPTPVSVLETGTSTNAWNSVPSPSEPSKNSPIDMPHSPVLSKSIGTAPIAAPTNSVNSTITAAKPVQDVSATAPPVPPEPKAPAPKPQQTVPTSFIKMGHWETDDADDNNLDFGFGTFDAPTVTTAPTSASNEGTSNTDVSNSKKPTTNEQTQASTQPIPTNASPARPPPGLTIGGGMPPMPPNAVLVHELENKLEEVSMNANAKQNVSVPEKQMNASIQQQQPSHIVTDVSGAQVAAISQATYGNMNHYTAMGMAPYSYGAGPAATPSNAFMGMPGPGGPILGAPQQPPKPPQPAGGPQQQAGAAGLYGTPHSAQTAGTAAALGGANNDTAPTSNAGMPPGMPPNPNMPYGNPALYYGQQPPFHMGQHQGGLGYNYYGAQFGGAVQGGFGYPQAMGQSGAYGHAPHYDDQGVAGTHSHQQQGSGGGYQQ
jgi:hypothetical protein